MGHISMLSEDEKIVWYTLHAQAWTSQIRARERGLVLRKPSCPAPGFGLGCNFPTELVDV